MSAAGLAILSTANTTGTCTLNYMNRIQTHSWI